MAPIKQFSVVMIKQHDVSICFHEHVVDVDGRLTRDVLEMATVLQPGTTGGDVVGGALALDLDEDGEVLGSLAVPGLEGLEELETVRLGVDGDLDAGAVGGGSLEGVLTGVVAAGRELVAGGVLELEGLAVSTDERVGQGVEGEAAGEGQSGGEIGGSDKGVGGGVSVVTASEVTVVGGDDCVEDLVSHYHKEKTCHALVFFSPFLVSCLSH